MFFVPFIRFYISTWQPDDYPTLCCTLFYHILHVKCPQSPANHRLGPKQVIFNPFTDNRSALAHAACHHHLYISIINMPLIPSLFAHCLPLNSFQFRVRAIKGYFITPIATENPSFILARFIMPHAYASCYACCWTGYTINRMDYHKIKRFTYSLSCHPL